MRAGGGGSPRSLASRSRPGPLLVLLLRYLLATRPPSSSVTATAAPPAMGPGGRLSAAASNLVRRGGAAAAGFASASAGRGTARRRLPDLRRRRLLVPSSSFGGGAGVPSNAKSGRPPSPPRGVVARSRRESTTGGGGGGALRMSIDDTPLGRSKAGAALLGGLDVYVVPAADDGHPISVFGIHSEDASPPPPPPPLAADAPADDVRESPGPRRPILLLHGRTWSSVPVYHLLGGPADGASPRAPGRESRSLMEALHASGLQPYAMDFRGFGGTPRDDTGWVEPNRCVRDVETVLRFIAQRHGLADPESGRGETASEQHRGELPALLGWSQGALVAQLVAQRNPALLSKLVLYGSIYDPSVRYPRAPLYVSSEPNKNTTVVMNEYDAAIEDFTVEGSIPPEPARLFAEAALTTDPVKAAWKYLHQFNNCDPARVHVPTLVVAGDQDPYAPLHVQAELFTNLGRGADRTWSIIAGADHAVHLLDGRARFVKIVSNFLETGRRGGGESGEMF